MFRLFVCFVWFSQTKASLNNSLLHDLNVTDFKFDSDNIDPKQSNAQIECALSAANTASNGEIWCTSEWDDFYCWPPTRAGQMISLPCVLIFASLPNMPSFKEIYTQNDAKAYRICDNNGKWLWGNWTNYTECLKILPTHSTESMQLFVGYILFICSLVSMVLLIISLFIFFYFKSLICSRLRVHRNLVVALIIHSFLLVLISSPVVVGSSLTNYKNIEWLCKLVLSLKLYAALACINWMFIEGLLLHSRITISIFRRDAPFRLYYCLGWGMPFLIITVWALTMSQKLSTSCWAGYGDSIYVWILTGPMITALLVNCIFLINIIRILVTKLRLTISVEMEQIRKAIKATALLFPLLGISHLLFCVNPGDNGQLEDAYMITNALLQSSQGIFVSILYCFLNSEVQTVLRNAYLRASVRRGAGGSKSFSVFARNSSNRRSQRFLSQTSASFVSHWEVGPNNKTNDGDIELAEVSSCADTSKKKSVKANKNQSSPRRKCLLFCKPGKQVMLWKDPTKSVCENGGNKSNSVA